MLITFMTGNVNEITHRKTEVDEEDADWLNW